MQPNINSLLFLAFFSIIILKLVQIVNAEAQAEANITPAKRYIVDAEANANVDVGGEMDMKARTMEATPKNEKRTEF